MMRLTLLICMILPILSSAQDDYFFGMIPVVNGNIGLKNDFRLNVQLENRHVFKGGTFGGETTISSYEFERQDLSLALSRKVSADIELAGGYQIRYEAEEIIHRTMQQISFSQPLSRTKLAHRFKADQTWEPSEVFELRLRYRFGLEYPMFGQKLDPNELYLKSNVEYLAEFQAGLTNEFRWTPALGYLGRDKNSFEIGLDYRLEGIFDEVSEHGFWLYAGYYWRI
jgi:hypothetical protein